MNKQIIDFCLVFLASLFQVCGTGLSETNNGLFLAVGGEHSGTNEPIRFHERIAWRPFCNINTGKTDIELQYPNARYGIKMKMTDPDGKVVSKTGLGDIWGSGSKWNQLHSYKDSRLSGVTAGPYRPDVGAGGGQWLPAPKDLFEMEKPGIYTLEIQMQMFRHTGSTDPNEEYRNLIRFSPVKIRVEKPPEVNANSSLNTQTNPPAK